LSISSSVVILGFLVISVGIWGAVSESSKHYTIKVYNFDSYLNVNALKYHTCDWSIIPRIGICPNRATKSVENDSEEKSKIFRLMNIIFCYVIYVTLFIGMICDNVNHLLLSLFPISLACISFIVSMSLVANTCQLNEKAWSTYCFETYNVHIIYDDGY
jgi:hypothetical protein